MFSRIKYPQTLSHEELDEYLANGWRCMGQAIYTSHFMFFPPENGDKVYSTLPTRLPLEGYRFRKSLRKIYNKAHRYFQVQSGIKATFSTEEREVNRLYGKHHPDKAIDESSNPLDNGWGQPAFDTREVRIYDEEKLIAFSYFAMGKEAIYSKQGIYDPEYKQYSLGFFTMLEEIAYAQSQGLKYFYPGYVVPGYEEFDYKKRVGPLNYYDLPTDSWRSLQALKEEEVPINRMRKKLEDLQLDLQKEGIKSNVIAYRFFDIRFYDNRPYPFMEFPLLLPIKSSNPSIDCPIAVFHPQEENYTLYNCRYFGQGIQHLNAARYVLQSNVEVLKVPIAIFDTYAEQLSLAEIKKLLYELDIF